MKLRYYLSLSKNTMLKKRSYAQLEERLKELESVVYSNQQEINSLRQSDTKFRLLYEKSPLPYQSLDMDGRIVEVNPVWLSLFGYTRQEVIGTSFVKYLPFDEIDSFNHNFLTLKNLGLVSSFEFHMLTKDGSSVYVSFDGITEKNDEGTFQQYYCLLHDITDRKVTENLRLKARDVWTRAFDSIDEIVTIQDKELTIIRANKAAHELFDAQEGLLTGRKCYEVFTCKSEPCQNCPVLVSIKKGGQHSAIIIHAKLDKVFMVSSYVIPIRDGEEYLLHVARDITKERAAEIALRESEERFSKAFRSNPAPMAISEINSGLFIDVNQRFTDMLGYSRDELIGQTIKRKGIWADPAERDRFLTGLSRKTFVSEQPVTFKDKSGKSRAALWSAEKITIQGQDLMLSLIHDISERVKAEAECDRLVAAVEQASDAIVITDTEGHIQYVNPAFEMVTGYSHNEVLGNNPRFLKSGKQDDQFYKTLWQTLSNGQDFKERLVNKRKDGTFFTEEATISPIFNREGQAVNYVAVKRDITDQIRLEAQFQQAQKMEAVGLLAGGVAHDFNNTLAVIIGYTEMALEHNDLGQELHNNIGEILDAAHRSADIVRQLLAFSRKQTVAPKVLDLNNAVERILKMLYRLIGEDTDLSWIPESGSLLINMDPIQIDQILVNLCVNAKDAINGVGKVTIETSMVTLDEEYCANHIDFRPGTFVLLSVSDNGIGIDKKTQKHIFEPFFSSKELGRGTGLGLSTVYGIVKKNDGFINVYSELGKGTTFKIYIPLCKDEIPESKEKATTKNSESHGETVLLVEDESALLAMAQKMLERLGYNVLAVNRPSKALEIAEDYADKIDLLFTDVVMPEMTGKELANLIQKHRPGLKVLFMSGYTANVIAHNGILDEGIQFIQKPYSTGDLAYKIRTVLGMDSVQAEMVMK